MVHPPPVPGPPPGASSRLPSTRGQGPLVVVLASAAALAAVLVVCVVAYAVVASGGDDPAARAASGPVDLSEPLTFKLVEEESEQPCKAGALSTGANSPCYTFGPEELTVRRLEKVEAAPPDPASGGLGWSVQLTLTSADASGFADLTGKAAEAFAYREPSGSMGMLVGGLLVSDPMQVEEPITGGEVQISGPADRFTRAYAENLVHRMIGK